MKFKFRQARKDEGYHYWGVTDEGFVYPLNSPNFVDPSESEIFTGFYYFDKIEAMLPNLDKPIFEGDSVDHALFLHDMPGQPVRHKQFKVKIVFENGCFCMGSHSYPLKKHTYFRYTKPKVVK